jgi:hypothetical protein
MIKNILIAAAIKPLPGKTWQGLYDCIRRGATDFNCVVMGGIVTGGRGCINMGLKIQGDNEKSIDVFGKQLCLAMMPAKWGDTPSIVEDGFICDIEKEQRIAFSNMLEKKIRDCGQHEDD